MTIDTRPRCAWAQSDPMMAHYHDTEWGMPVRDARMLWETLMLEGFQAGLSWDVILRKRDAFRAAFAGFDPARVAAFTEADIPACWPTRASCGRAPRSRRPSTARASTTPCRRRGEDFADFCWSFTGGEPLARRRHRGRARRCPRRVSKDLKRRGFKFVGPTIVHAWMQAVGIVDDHAPGCFLHRPR